MLSCLIIDDDPLICDLLEHFCKKSGQFEYCISVGNCTDGLRLLSTSSFDLIFLDFNLPDMSGRDFLELKSDDSQVIMVTSQEDFAVESYNYPSIIDFLPKPISYERFEKALARLYSSPEPKSDNDSIPEEVFVKEGYSLVRIVWKDVLFLKAEGNYVSIQSDGRNVMTLSTLSAMSSKLPSYFSKTHRSYFVNLKQVQEVTQEEVKVGDKQIPLSTSYREDILSKIQALL